MDFYLPDAKIAVFVDGAIWHADPRIYKGEDVLFFGKKISRHDTLRSVTAKDVWEKHFLKIARIYSPTILGQRDKNKISISTKPYGSRSYNIWLQLSPIRNRCSISY